MGGRLGLFPRASGGARALLLLPAGEDAPATAAAPAAMTGAAP
jgi:hypothetical protein